MLRVLTSERRYDTAFSSHRLYSPGMEMRSAAARHGPMGSTTSRSCPRAARATPTTSTSPWKLGDYRFDLPLLASAMDGVVSPDVAGAVGRLELAVLTSRASGPATRTPTSSSSASPGFRVTSPRARCRTSAASRSKPRADYQRIEEIKAQKVVAAALADPAEGHPALRAGVGGRARRPGHPGHGDLGRARFDRRGTPTPLNLKEFILLPIPVAVGGCAGLPHRPAPDADRRGGGARGRRRARPARRAGTEHRRPAGHGHRRRGRGALGTCSRPATTSRSSPTAGCATAATSPRRSPAAPTR